MRPVVQGVQRGGIWLGSRDLDRRAQGHLGDGDTAPIVLAHHRHGLIGVAINDQAGAGGEIEEEQHVATGHRRHQRLLRVHGGGSDMGAGTLPGAEEPRTTAPPSKRQSWARE